MRAQRHNVEEHARQLTEVNSQLQKFFERLNISRKTLIYRMEKFGLGESPETPSSMASSE